jgi:hypothetical protein
LKLARALSNSPLKTTIVTFSLSAIVLPPKHHFSI